MTIRSAGCVTRSHIVRGVEFVAGKSYYTLDRTRVVAVHKMRRMPRNVHALVSVGDRPPVWVDVRYTGREELITVEDSGVVYIASARRALFTEHRTDGFFAQYTLIKLCAFETLVSV